MNWEAEEARLYMSQRLRVAFAASGHNGSTIASRLGVSVSVVSKWTRGAHMPSPENLKAIADITGASLDWLLTQNPVVLKNPETTT